MILLANWRAYWHSAAGPREVLRLALPLVLSTSSLTIQVFVDRMFLAWYSEEAIAAAVPAVCVMWVLVAPLHGIVSFANTFVAQYHGAGRDERTGPVVGQAVLVALFGGLATLVLVPASPQLFEFVGHAPEVRALEVIYFQTLLVSAAPMLVTLAASSFFGGLGRTWIVLLINLVATVVNVVLDYAMIFGRWGFPEWGIAGAGWATAIAHLAAAMLAIALLWAADEHGRFGVRSTRGIDRGFCRMDRDLMGRLFRFGGPAGFMMLVDVAGWTAFVLLVGRIGTEALAASNVAFNINMLAIVPMLGLGTATQILVGQRLGEDRPDLAARSTWSAFWLAFVYTAVLGAGYILTPDLFIAPFQWHAAVPAAATDLPDTAAMSGPLGYHDVVVALLRFVALYTLFDMAAMIFSGALRGAGDTRFVMSVTLAAAVGVLAVPTYVACERYRGGILLAWGFATLYVLVLGTAFVARFQRGTWRSMRVIERVEPVPA